MKKVVTQKRIMRNIIWTGCRSSSKFISSKTAATLKESDMILTGGGGGVVVDVLVTMVTRTRHLEDAGSYASGPSPPGMSCNDVFSL
ncbi:Hypp8501 [Branchiostoma lanceolatum]|uniref:Hypp8501 protein n=1 Tax=Branchiostoma lanceolatum TaxID=7740 RepID=A0A8J9Z7B3_BRALA|nr:Hypp8501 [Branchiostoma lanceolatum]